MRPLCVVHQFPYRALDLVALFALQLERQGYVVRIARRRDPLRVVVGGFHPHGGRWVELLRLFSRGCWFWGHKWLLEKTFQRQTEVRRYLFRCWRCGASRVTRALSGEKSHDAV